MPISCLFADWWSSKVNLSLPAAKSQLSSYRRISCIFISIESLGRFYYLLPTGFHQKSPLQQIEKCMNEFLRCNAHRGIGQSVWWSHWSRWNRTVEGTQIGIFAFVQCTDTLQNVRLLPWFAGLVRSESQKNSQRESKFQSLESRPSRSEPLP